MNYLRNDLTGLVHAGLDPIGNRTQCEETPTCWTIADAFPALSVTSFVTGVTPEVSLCAACFPAGLPPAEPEEAAQIAGELVMQPFMIDADGGLVVGGAGWVGRASPTSVDPRAAAMAADVDAREAAAARREREERIAALEDRHELAVVARGGARGHQEVLAAAAAQMDSFDVGNARRERLAEQKVLNGEVPGADPALIAAAERRRKHRESAANAAALQAEAAAHPVTQQDIANLNERVTKTTSWLLGRLKKDR